MVLVALYVGATIYHTKKMPESVSAMVYAFPFKWLWTIWLWLVTFQTTKENPPAKQGKAAIGHSLKSMDCR
jgi:hypothetical protein